MVARVNILTGESKLWLETAIFQMQYDGSVYEQVINRHLDYTKILKGIFSKTEAT